MKQTISDKDKSIYELTNKYEKDKALWEGKFNFL